jgi:hypothetical protein
MKSGLANMILTTFALLLGTMWQPAQAAVRGPNGFRRMQDDSSPFGASTDNEAVRNNYDCMTVTVKESVESGDATGMYEHMYVE